ncbi:glycosyltransferase [Campylobacter sp. CNRCH_2016_0050h]|uniref:glycosyltransferase n=1 Tax=Campylobacter sp. CNRCH_2016_0050h TaxID=2911608 RepID=UPI0021E69017|nr:glycosyltransferase [Campylobacter sp. CNRCH_2016_0050h]MCV3457207.1 glycosyltransferase [Campylobacter sp. CNRCH_2016_0050h]
MRIVDILNYFKDSGFNKVVNLIEDNNIEIYCKISEEFVLPYSSNLQDVEDKTIVLVDIANMINFKEIFNLDLATVCFCTKEEIITYTNLANLFSRCKLKIINIQDTNLNLVAILALKNTDIYYNDEKLILNQRCEILSKELEDYKGSRLKYKRLYETSSKELDSYKITYEEQIRSNEILSKELDSYKITYEEQIRSNEILSKELEDYKGSRLKYKRLYEKCLKELEDYKGSRLKYKRIASFYEFKYNQLKQQKIIKMALKIKKMFSFFNKNQTNKQKLLESKTIDLYKTVYANKKLSDFVKKNQDKPIILLYGDINLNVVDGSSVWLSSIFNLAILDAHVIIFSKVNIQNNLIISNFMPNIQNNYLILEPKDLNIREELSVSEISQILNYIDYVTPNIQLLITRGIAVTHELTKNNNFKYRLVPYLTDFYILNKNGIQLKELAGDLLKNINRHVNFWLWQTQEMKEFVEQKTNIKFNKSFYFPPVVFDKNTNVKQKYIKKSDEIIIGYGGKIQPEWGVLELILKVKELNDKGKKIKLLIISSKISARSDFDDYPEFIEKIKKCLVYNFVEYYPNLNRNQTLEKLSSVDYLYGFRPKYFEQSTLEISTKILESLVLEKPIICYPNIINKKLFGKQYPYFINEIDELESVIENKNQVEIDYKALVFPYLFDNRKNFFEDKLSDVKNKKITIASHDYKFIDHFYSYLKSIGFMVDKDLWEWGDNKYLDRSKYCVHNSDVIFCEWGLSNAVWYSKNISKNNKLIVRIHAQEVRQKAVKFGHQLNIENVDKIIFVSERIRKLASDIFGWQENTTCVIPNYVLMDDFICNDLHKKIGLNFGMVGITPQSKRLDRALDLLENILKIYPEAKLYIKGMRPEQYEWMHAPGRVCELEYYYKQYDRIEKNIALKNAVVFDEYGNNMPEWYQKIDFILSPSDHESFHYALADGVISGCIPILWNWEEAEKIYTKEWIIKDVQSALDYIKFVLNYNSRESLRKKNIDIVKNRYNNVKIYQELKEKVL